MTDELQLQLAPANAKRKSGSSERHLPGPGSHMVNFTRTQ
eukprot:CAMPEP_0185558548 /NCGR_PEP_ID=MMETSP1381-20130426/52516_1 /TAXON_ID=298111 /ORGANISM="Pavlova sp., Strain CCMP459" /LENGTH=39 /DNA_ID= /DNA_START= /DNA_END= /DNA_ORIENTATION=